MSTAQQRIDTALGSLAATAAATGCPQSQVHRMCEVSEYTRGLDTLTLSGSASGTVDLALQAGAVGDCGVSGLVTEAADAVKGIAGGEPCRQLCRTGDVLATVDQAWQGVAGSLASCGASMEQITTGCADAVAVLVDNVCGLIGSVSGAVSGTGSVAGGPLSCELAGELARGAVDTVTGLLEQRNCSLEAVVEITAGDCSSAAEAVCPVPEHEACAPEKCPQPGEQGDADICGTSVAECTDGTDGTDGKDGAGGMCGDGQDDTVATCSEVPVQPTPGDAGVPEQSEQSEQSERGGTGTSESGSPSPDTGGTGTGSVDPVEGFDKTGRTPSQEVPAVLSAGVEPGGDGGGVGGADAAGGNGEPGRDESMQDSSVGAGESWSPDVWVTADGVQAEAPETAGEW